MTSHLLAVSRVSVAICNLIDYIEESNVKNENNVSMDINKGSKMLTVALDIISEVAKLSGATTSQIESISLAQLFNSLTAFPLEFNKFKESPDKSVSKFISNVVLIPMSKSVFYCCQATYYQEQNYLAMVEKDPNAQRPIYEDVPDNSDSGSHIEIVGYRPIDADECKKAMESAKETANSSAVALAVGKGKVVENTAKRINEIRQSVEVYLFGKPAIDACETDFFSSQNTIPPALEKDVILSKFICAITKKPIRHLTVDPDNKTLYEREAIISYIQTHGKSPATQQPLTANQLRDNSQFQNMIDLRLAQHDQIHAKYQEKQNLLKIKTVPEPKPPRQTSSDDNDSVETSVGNY